MENREILGGKYQGIDKRGRPYVLQDGQRFSPVDVKDGSVIFPVYDGNTMLEKTSQEEEPFRYRIDPVPKTSPHGRGRPRNMPPSA